MTQPLSARYSRQILLPEIQDAGQQSLGRSAALVVGTGALGSAIAELLTRAGVGRIKVVDRDLLEMSNLHRQILYSEDDASQQRPKALAAAERLRAINSSIQIDAEAVDVTSRNVLALVGDFDVIVDGTDNVETRYLINDACVKLGKPWIYGGAVGTSGVVMSIVPGKGPCLRCVFPDPPPPGTLPTCDTAGVLGTVPVAIGALQATRAIKILLGDLEAIDSIFSIDLWHGDHAAVSMPRAADCPACGANRFEFLTNQLTSWTTTLCGRNAVQVTPPSNSQIDLEDLEKKLSPVTTVRHTGLTLECELEGHQAVIFPDGRVIVKSTTDVSLARGLLSKYLGW